MAQSWPPIVLVAGLLLIGAVVAEDGLFEAVGTRLARLPLPPYALLVALLGLDAVVTAVLNLDTAVLFLTPVLVHAARSRGLDERPFLYGSVFMANSASLLLPGSNLTNLLVLARTPASGAHLAGAMFPAWLAAVAITAGFVALVFRLGRGDEPHGALPQLRLGLGVLLVLSAAMLVLLLRNPAPAVLALGLLPTAYRRIRPRIGLPVLTALFALATAFGVVARAWPWPGHLLDSSGAATAAALAAAALAAAASVLIDNLPAAVMLSAHTPRHPLALLLGLDLGPNLAVTGSLSAILWLRAARSVGARASVVAYSGLGAALVPLTLLGSLAALRVL